MQVCGRRGAARAGLAAPRANARLHKAAASFDDRLARRGARVRVPCRPPKVAARSVTDPELGSTGAYMGDAVGVNRGEVLTSGFVIQQVADQETQIKYVISVGAKAHHRIEMREFEVCGAKPSHHTLQNFRGKRVCVRLFTI